MKKLLVIFTFLQFISFSQQAQESSPPVGYVISHVNIVDTETSTIITDQTVLIDSGKIVEIFVSGDYTSDAETIINGNGRYLMPGLFDNHAHITGNLIGETMRDGPLYLRYGVTSILNLQGDKETLIFRDSTESAQLWPNLFTSGWYINKPMFSTSSEVLEQLKLQESLGFDVIKIHGDFDLGPYVDLMETMKRRGLRLIGHAPRNLGIFPVVKFGQNLAHSEELLYTAFTPIAMPIYLSGFICYVLIVTILLLVLLLTVLIIPFKPLKVKFFRVLATLTMNGMLFLILLLLTITPVTPLLVNTLWVRPVLVSIILLEVAVGYYWMKLPHKFKYHYLLLTTLVSLIILQSFLVYHTLRSTNFALRKLAREMSEAGCIISPGLVTIEWIGKEQSENGLKFLKEQPEIKYISSYQRQWWDDFASQKRTFKNLFASGYTQNLKLLQQFLKYFNQAGGVLIPGTDSGGFVYLIPGKSLQRELQLLVGAGLSPAEVLKSATVKSAEFLGVDSYIGKIRVGFQADLVLLSENPFANIKGTSSIEGVMLKGRWYDLETLDKSLEELVP